MNSHMLFANIERHLFHVIGGSIFPISSIWLDQDLLTALIATTMGITIVLEITRQNFQAFNDLFIHKFNLILKESEHKSILGSTYLIAGTLATFILFEQEIAILTLLYLAVGDPVAAIIGNRYGRTIKVRSKSIEGAFAFLAVASFVGFISITLGFNTPIHIALAGAFIAAITELLAIPPDDNLSVPLVAGLIMTTLI